MEWIRVEDRLPENKSKVLVIANSGCIRYWVDAIKIHKSFVKYEKNGRYSILKEYPYFEGLDGCDECYRDYESYQITHWQDLPELPDKSKKEESDSLWIDVYDRLPEKGEDVLVTDGKNLWVDFAIIPKFIKYKKDGSRYYEYNYFSGVQGCPYCDTPEISGVTHWMKLPENPKNI